MVRSGYTTYVILQGTHITKQNTKQIVHDTTTSKLELTQASLVLVPQARELETTVTSLSIRETIVEVIFTTMPFEAVFEAAFPMAAEIVFVPPSIASASRPHALQPH